MQIVAVASTKGGVGKSTTSIHLAAGAASMGKRVLLVDADPQGSTRDWGALAEDKQFTVVAIDRPTLDKDLKQLASSFDLAIIDCPPRDNNILISAIKCADLMIVPATPSPLDLWALADFVDILKQRKEAMGKPDAVFLLSNVIKNTGIGREMESALDEAGLPVMNTVVHRRVAYPKMFATGKTVFDLQGDTDEKFEMRKLLKEVFALLDTTLNTASAA